MKTALSSRRFAINIAVWLALSLFYEVYSLLSKTQIVSTVQVALENAHLYVAANLTLWSIWCGLAARCFGENSPTDLREPNSMSGPPSAGSTAVPSSDK